MILRCVRRDIPHTVLLFDTRDGPTRGEQIFLKSFRPDYYCVEKGYFIIYDKGPPWAHTCLSLALERAPS